jgi:hypothetical protein
MQIYWQVVRSGIRGVLEFPTNLLKNRESERLFGSELLASPINICKMFGTFRILP